MVQYANPAHAENVRSKLNGTKIDTKTMHVTYVAPGFNKIKEILDRAAQVVVSPLHVVLSLLVIYRPVVYFLIIYNGASFSHSLWGPEMGIIA